MITELSKCPVQEGHPTSSIMTDRLLVSDTCSAHAMQLIIISREISCIDINNMHLLISNVMKGD